MGEEQAKPCVGSSASKAFEFIPVVRGEKEGKRGGGGGGGRGGVQGEGEGGGLRELETDRQTDIATRRDRERWESKEVDGRRGWGETDIHTARSKSEETGFRKVKSG